MTNLGEAIESSFEDFFDKDIFLARLFFLASLIACLLSLFNVANDLVVDHYVTNIIPEIIVFVIAAIVLFISFFYWRYDGLDLLSILEALWSSFIAFLYVFVPFVLFNIIFKNIELMFYGNNEYVLGSYTYIPALSSGVLVLTFCLPFCLCAIRNFCDTDNVLEVFNIKEIVISMYGYRGGIHIASFLLGLAILGIAVLISFLLQGVAVGILSALLPPVFLLLVAPIYPFMFFNWTE